MRILAPLILSLLSLSQVAIAQTFTVSEEDPPATCPSGLVASSFLCEGDFCDDITFSCNSIAPTAGFSRWTHWVEHDGQQVADCRDPMATGTRLGRSAMTGLACRGGNCDDVALQCTTFPGFVRDDTRCVSFDHTDGDPMIRLPAGSVIRSASCSGRHCDDMVITICPFERE